MEKELIKIHKSGEYIEGIINNFKYAITKRSLPHKAVPFNDFYENDSKYETLFFSKDEILELRKKLNELSDI